MKKDTSQEYSISLPGWERQTERRSRGQLGLSVRITNASLYLQSSPWALSRKFQKAGHVCFFRTHLSGSKPAQVCSLGT